MNAPKRSAPFSSLRQFSRVLIKAITLLLIFDVVQMALNLPHAIDRWPIYRSFTPPTSRLGLSDQIGDPIWWRLDPLLDAHEIAQPKAPDEFRVIFLGDSATFCLYCRSTEAIPFLFTQLDAIIAGKHVRGYNLAYPGSDWLKDILILKHAMRYQPDAIVWLVTAKGAGDQPLPQEPDAHLITRLNADELPALARDLWSRPYLLLSSISLFMEMRRRAAMAFSWSQKAASIDRLVRWPAIRTECFRRLCGASAACRFPPSSLARRSFPCATESTHQRRSSFLLARPDHLLGTDELIEFLGR